MYQLTATSLYLALLSLIYLALSLEVIRRRWRYRVWLGTGESKELRNAARTHANFAEYIPLALLLMLVAEINGLSFFALHTAGILLIIGRICTSYALYQHKMRPRQAGFILTWLVIIGLSFYDIAIFLFSYSK